MKRSSALVAVLLLAGCLSLEDPAPSQNTRLVVHAILDAQANQQVVLVYRARTGAPNGVESSNFSDDEPVAGAEVFITTPEGITLRNWLLGKESGQCCVAGTYLFPDSLTGSWLTPGGTYSLRIRTSLGEEVVGKTIMPGPAQLTHEPSRIFFRLQDTLRLNWPRVPGAASYEVIIAMPRFGERFRTFANTAFTLPGTALTIAGDEIFQRGQDMTIVVTAVDVNYYDYYRSQSDPFAGAAPSHLSGAVGVFGSVVPIYATELVVR